MRLTRQTLWTGASPAYVGAALFATLAALRVIATATTARVFVAGREVSWGCLFRRAFGIPCPVCGMTRGVLLTLHGQLTDALSTNPAAPLLVAGVALFASAMIFAALYQRTHAPRETGRLHARLRLALRAYAGALFAVLFAHWVAEIFGR